MKNKNIGLPIKKLKERSLLSKVMIPMLLLGILEVTAFGIIMLASGELDYIKRFSYNLLTEKTCNRASYIENMLNQKTSLVYNASVDFNQLTEDYLAEHKLTTEDMLNDKNICRKILNEYSEELVSLIRMDMVNDAFIILDNHDSDSPDGSRSLAGLYLRDTDVYDNSTIGNKDIYMEMGSSNIAKALGTALDSEWSPDLILNDENDFSFYTMPMEAYLNEPNKPIYDLGYWSGFSKISFSAGKSMKYTLPLVSSDGEVYGVIGIGLLEKTILKNIPANDFYNETACYIIANDLSSNGKYIPVIHSGPIYNRLVTDRTVFDESAENEYNVYKFKISGLDHSLGSIQRITLYNAGSPYLDQHWALISAADKSSVMNIYNAIINVFIISIFDTILCCIVFSFFVGRRISMPVSKMVTVLNNIPENNDTVLSFSKSGISEIDELASSIVQLQINANEYASRVSKIITLTDSKIGVFMFSLINHSVFVNESLTKIMDFEGVPHGDITISEDSFKMQLFKIDSENRILNLDFFTDPANVSDTNKSIEIKSEKDGKEVWYKFTLSVTNTDVIGLVQDITETVAEKEKIARFKDDEYTEKLLKANKALRDAYDNARRADNAKTDFLSRMSHDIRTPMNAIVGMTMIANSNIDDRQKVSDCLGKITVSSNYLLSLINDVLDMSKIESGKFELTEDKININELLEHFEEMVQPSVKEKNHTIAITKHNITHENIIGDSVRIQQVFMNIVSNSVKYTNEGGLITVDITEKPVGSKNIGCYEFVFKDNGIGMTEDFLQNIFEPFERAEDERVSKQQGTGLGMPITYNLVKMMNGDIQVESKLGEGSVFTVTLFFRLCGSGETVPLGSAETSIDELKHTHFPGKRILLVEDNELNREIATELLKLTDVEIECAENGKAAVKKFNSSEPNHYDLIFMDIQMPVMNGYAAAGEIRKLMRYDAKSVPIIAMTADAFAEDVKKALNSGMNEHISKPLDIDKLVAVLRKWLK